MESSRGNKLATLCCRDAEAGARICAQLPCIQHGKRKVADSAFIIKYLERTYPEVVPQLTAEQEALSVAVQHLVESFLYWGLFYHRWINPKVRPCVYCAPHALCFAPWCQP